MRDSFPWWAVVLKKLGWCVSQEFQVMSPGYVLWTSGMPTRKDAEDRCDSSQGQWVRRVIEVWRD